MGAVNNGAATGRDTLGRFGAGNAGRPRGSKNAVTLETLRTAREHFGPLVPDAERRVKTHLQGCEREDCATCRHYVELVYAYVYGRPRQAVELDDHRREPLDELAERVAARTNGAGG